MREVTRRSFMSLTKVAAVVFAFVLAAAPLMAPAGQQQTGNRWPQRPSNASPLDEDAAPDPVLAARQMRALNVERQKSLVSDANKLLELAKELHTEVNDPKSDAPTPQQLHKVTEIEKLAHNVKEKMSFSVGGAPNYRDPIFQPMR